MFKYAVVWKPVAGDLKVWSAEVLDEARQKARYVIEGAEFDIDDTLEIADLSWRRADGTCHNMLMWKDVNDWHREHLAKKTANARPLKIVRVEPEEGA